MEDSAFDSTRYINSWRVHPTGLAGPRKLHLVAPGSDTLANDDVLDDRGLVMRLSIMLERSVVA